MIEFAVELEASDPARNIWRSYQIAGGQDLFGNWIVELTYGRIGTKGRTKTVLVADEAAAHRYARQCLKRRQSAPKRIGVGYRTVRISGAWPETERAK